MILETEKAYLAGFVDGDATIGYYHGSGGIIRFYNTSKEFIDFASNLLKKAGINHTVGINPINYEYELRRGANPYNWKPRHILTITRKDDINKMKEFIGNYLILKKAQLDCITDTSLRNGEKEKIIKQLNKVHYNKMKLPKIRITDNKNDLVETFYAYVSGLFDAEGSIYNRPKYTIGLTVVANCDVRIIKYIYKSLCYAGYDLSHYMAIKNNKGKKIRASDVIHSITILNKDTITLFIKNVQKYLIIKRERVKVSLEIINNINREDNLKLLKNLNKRGIHLNSSNTSLSNPLIGMQSVHSATLPLQPLQIR